MSTLPKQTSNSKALTSKAASLWPLWFLLLAAPATVVFTALQLPLLNKWPLYGLVLWTMALFCYAHRMVYFYHVRKAKKWVYVVAMPCVLALYPSLFMCLLFVAAMEQSLRH